MDSLFPLFAKKQLRILIIHPPFEQSSFVQDLIHGDYEPLFEQVANLEKLDMALQKRWDIIIADSSLALTRWAKTLFSYVENFPEVAIFILPLEQMNKQKTWSFLNFQNSLLKAIPAIIYSARATRDYGITYISEAIFHQFGYQPHEFLTNPQFFFDRIHPDDRSQIQEGLQNLLAQNFYAQEYRFQHKDGNYIWVYDTKRLIRSEKGEPLKIVGCLVNINEKKVKEDEIKFLNVTLEQEVAKRTRQLANFNKDITLLYEMGNMLQASYSYGDALEVISKFISRMFPNFSGGLFLLNESKTLLEPIIFWGELLKKEAEAFFTPAQCWALRRHQVYKVMGQEASIYCEHIKAAPTNLPDYSLCVPLIAQRQILGLIHLQGFSSVREGLPAPSIDKLSAQELLDKEQLAITMSEQIALALSNLKMREFLIQQSIRDPLTGLFNRRFLEESLGREITRAKRRKTSLGIIMMDIDFFKNINDTYGHEAGDAVLKVLGNLLQFRVRGEDIVCRYGGDEFTIIMPGASLETIKQRAEQLRQIAEGHLMIKIDNQSVGPVTLSCGVAVFPDHGDSGEAVLQMADSALLAAKQKGRNRVEIAKI
ncbi:MAG: sensor domain-containing diguanylate cyclase [Thermodesulfobacteriota bacterium]